MTGRSDLCKANLVLSKKICVCKKQLPEKRTLQKTNTKKEGRRELQPVFTNHPNAKLPLLVLIGYRFNRDAFIS